MSLDRRLVWRAATLLSLGSLSILPRAQTGVSCAFVSSPVVTQLRIADGLALLASSEAQRSDNQGHTARWLGDLQALFIDSKGWLREDGDRNAQLGDYTQDPAVALDNDNSGTQLRRYNGDPALGLYNTVPYSALRPIWSAAARLAAISNPQTQRDYRSSSAARHLLTAIDLNLDGRIDASEQRPFMASSFGDSLYGIVTTTSAAAAANLVDYVRGVAVDGLRPRELGANAGVTQRLGMITHSAPLLVGAPAEAYDLLYGDVSYGAFVKRYRQRRHVVYVGARDGYLHAFNAGFRSSGGLAYQTTVTDGSGTAWPLGAELWAYAPFNLLPHLSELAGNGEPQHAVVDGTPRAFDARVFPDDGDHPGGWGTLLVIGMRLGGSAQTLLRSTQPQAYAGFISGPQQINTRPALLLFDISNPEAPPQLLAEISDAQLGYTLSTPALISAGQNAYLLFGSGPDDAGTATSSRNARLYLYDLRARQMVSGYAPRDLGSAAAAAFIGNPVSVDWDLDAKADAAYFGTASGNAGNPGGKLYKLDLAASTDPARWKLSVLLDANRPLLTTPAVSVDSKGNRWIYAGSGRDFVAADRYSTATQSVMAVIDRSTSLTLADLYNSSGAQLSADGLLSGIAGVMNYRELLAAVDAQSGWRVDWPQRAGSAERVLGDPLLLAQTLVINTYAPDGSNCSSGLNRLYQVDAASGALRIPNSEQGRLPASATPTPQAGPALQARLQSTLLAAGRRSTQIVTASTASPATLSTAISNGHALDDGEIDWWELHP